MIPPPRIRQFPYPFESDAYRYTTNVGPARVRVDTAAGHWGDDVIDVGPDRDEVLAERARILDADPRRAVSLPHMRRAAEDARDVVLTELARSRGVPVERWFGSAVDRWTDGPGSAVAPLEFAARQVQEDVVLLVERDGALRADAGVVTFASDWSMNFDLGMDFLDIHRPVPRLAAEGVAARALASIRSLDAGEWIRRTNWSTGIDGRLDASAETRSQWAPARRALADAPVDELSRRLSLRVEVQHLTRLAPSGAVMFSIRTYMLTLDELATVPGWAERFAEVVRELPDDMADYKGLTPLKPAVSRWARTLFAS